MKIKIPQSIEQKILEILEKLILNDGKVKINENDILEYLAEKIDNETIVISPEGKLTAIIEETENEDFIYQFKYDNPDSIYPTEMEKKDLNGNTLLRETYTLDNNKNVSRININDITRNKEFSETFEYIDKDGIQILNKYTFKKE